MFWKRSTFVFNYVYDCMSLCAHDFRCPRKPEVCQILVNWRDIQTVWATQTDVLSKSSRYSQTLSHLSRSEQQDLNKKSQLFLTPEVSDRKGVGEVGRKKIILYKPIK